MITNAKSLILIFALPILEDDRREHVMMGNKNNANNEDLPGRSSSTTIYFKDIRYFSVIVFMVSLMTAALINTQVGMKQIADLLAFFGLGYLVIGIAAQFIRMRK
jgi:hypothetical protein